MVRAGAAFDLGAGGKDQVAHEDFAGRQKQRLALLIGREQGLLHGGGLVGTHIRDDAVFAAVNGLRMGEGGRQAKNAEAGEQVTAIWMGWVLHGEDVP